MGNSFRFSRGKPAATEWSPTTKPILISNVDGIFEEFSMNAYFRCRGFFNRRKVCSTPDLVSSSHPRVLTLSPPSHSASFFWWQRLFLLTLLQRVSGRVFKILYLTSCIAPNVYSVWFCKWYIENSGSIPVYDPLLCKRFFNYFSSCSASSAV